MELLGVIIVGESEFLFYFGINLRDYGIFVMMFNLFENILEKVYEVGFEVFKGNFLFSNDRIYFDLLCYNKCILMI